MVAAVLVTISANNDDDPTPAVAPFTMEAVTVLLLLLKVISSLRALESFGFLVSMLISTAGAMVFFGVLLALMVLGFAVIFALLDTGYASRTGLKTIA
eukprot:SAG11_NODE_925_length_6524_cov_3.379300_4_plen_98_part_00